MLYFTCTMISSVDLAHDGVSRTKDWLSGDCGTRFTGYRFTISCFYFDHAKSALELSAI